MKDFGRLVRDVELVNTPYGSWQYARNIVKTKGYKSISNENSHKYHVLVPGVIIGIIETNTEIVYCVKNHDGSDEIGRVKLDANVPTYTTDIKTNLFNFKYTQPIEGIFIYNYKSELIIVLCDGVSDDANTPKILNLDNLSINLNASKELTNPSEFNKLELFPNAIEGNMDVSYLDSGSIQGSIAYITYSYVFEDGSSTSFFPINNIAYIAQGADTINRKGIRLKLTSLDTNFKKLRIGIVIKEQGVLQGFESYDISYTGNQKNIDITSLNNFTTTSAENITLTKSVFTRIESITKHRNEAIVGNYKTPKDINLQKYFLKLELKPYKYISTTNEPSLMPDEVYAMYVQVQWLNGTYSDAFHIPGRKAIGTGETDDWSNTLKSTYNNYWVDEIDSGNFKNFHFLNYGRVNLSGSLARFGFWQNEETYPNDSNYDGRTDYNGNPIENGEDLRNKPIRYHRMPAIADTMLLDNGNYVADSNNLDDNEFYHLGIKVTNFADVIPDEIKSKIQGYRICFVKRNFGNSYITGNYVMTRKGSIDWTQAGVPLTWEYHDFNLNKDSDEAYFGNLDINFSKGRLLANELFKFRPSLDLTYLKVNYLFSVNNKGTRKYPQSSNTFAKIKTNPKYVVGNNIAANTQYFEEGIDIEVEDEDFYRITDEDDNISAQDYVANISVIGHKTNLYSGFKSNNLVVLGRTTNLNNEVIFKGGDVFTDNEIDIQVNTAKLHRFTNAGGRTVVFRYAKNLKIKGLFSPLNSVQLFNNKIQNLNDVTIGDNERPERIDVEAYNSQDYDFEVKGEEDLSTINDINTILTFDISSNFINEFPFRVHRSLKVAKETLSTNSLRTFLTDDYYEMANDKGEIIAVRGTDRTLFIQHRFALFAASVKDKLRTDNIDGYLGFSDLFERPPEEVLYDEKGTIASVSKFSCKIIKGIYICINAVDGKIFLIKSGAKEITAIDNKNWFADNWDIGLDFYKLDSVGNKRRIDNPFVSVGYTVGYDELNERLIFTKKSYKPKRDYVAEGIFTFDGQLYKSSDGKYVNLDNANLFENHSKTLSFYLPKEEWICEHDYHPNLYYYTSNKLYAVVNKLNPNEKEADIYEFNDRESVGNYLGKKYDSYVDLAFTASTQVSKLLKSINFRTTVRDINGEYRLETINEIMVFNSHQCSGIIPISHGNLTRGRNNEFSFNEFRDLVIDESKFFLDESGSLILSNINNKKLWFERSNIIGKFVIVRLIMDNLNDKNVFIHEVNTINVISN